MKQITISIPHEKKKEVINYLQNELMLNSIKVISGDNYTQIIVYIDQKKVGPFMCRLDSIGLGVTYGQIISTNIDVLKPLLKETNNLSLDVKSKISSEEIYDTISSNSILTFDYILYICLASIIAGIGLITDNSIMIVSSMLLSPMMGPILAFCFGTIISDRDLIIRGLKNEFIAIIIAFTIGILIGLVTVAFIDIDLPYEMETRGTKNSLLTGLAFAIPAGLSVGISVSMGGINNFVGVAIAASLLPPVVNSGISLIYGLLYETEYLIFSYYSLLLFLLNIVIIYVTTLITFKLKKIKPFRRQSIMWKELERIRKN